MKHALTILAIIGFAAISSHAYSKPDPYLVHSGDPNIIDPPDPNIKECRSVRFDMGNETNIDSHKNNGQTTDMSHTFTKGQSVSVLHDDDYNDYLEVKNIDFDPNKAKIWSASCERAGLRGGKPFVVDSYPARPPYEGTGTVTCDRGGMPVDANAVPGGVTNIFFAAKFCWDRGNSPQ